MERFYADFMVKMPKQLAMRLVSKGKSFLKLLAVNHTDNSSLLCTKGECHIQTLVSENFGPLNAYYDVNNVSISVRLFILQTIISRWQNQQN